MIHVLTLMFFIEENKAMHLCDDERIEDCPGVAVTRQGCK